MLYCKLATSWPQCHKPWETWKIYSLCSFSKYSVPVRPWGVSQRVRLWGQPDATAATYRARKEVLKGAGHKLCWLLTLTTAVVVVLIHSIAFYTVFLGNMVSAVFKWIHTEKCKKLLLFFFLVAHVLGKDAKHHTYSQPTLLKMLQENTPEPSLKSSVGPLSAEMRSRPFVWSDFIYICSHFFFYCPSKRKISQTTSVPTRKAVYQASHVAKELVTLFFCCYSKFSSHKFKFC